MHCPWQKAFGHAVELNTPRWLAWEKESKSKVLSAIRTPQNGIVYGMKGFSVTCVCLGSLVGADGFGRSHGQITFLES